MEDSGYAGSEVTVETDQEESIIASTTAIAAARIGDTVQMISAVRFSKSDGRTEGSIRIWQGQLGTFKHEFEFQIKRQLLSTSAMLSWLVVWSAEDMNMLNVQEDGRTAYKAITKHKCTHLVVGFGELIRREKAPAKPNPDKLDGAWRDGIFLGVIWTSGEYVVGTAEGVFKCSTIKTRPFVDEMHQ